MKYGLNDRLKFIPNLMYGLQWLVVSVPSIIVMGLVVAKLHFGEDIAAQTLYMQKLFGIIGLTIVIQVLSGHRLPLVVGPASVLLIGILSSAASGVPMIYTAIMIGGILMAIIAFSGVLIHLKAIFTPRIITVILILVAITLSPVIIRLIFESGVDKLFNFGFSILFVTALIIINNILQGVWKSTTLVWGIIAGSVIYFSLFGFPSGSNISNPDNLNFFYSFRLDFGVILSFIICFLALMVNELGSIQAVSHMLNADRTEKRITRGVGITGIMNMLSGAVGMIGPVDYSSSPGIISATGCASRYPLIPAGAGLILLSFLPGVVSDLLFIPGAVMGSILLYIMASQLAAGMEILVRDRAVTDYKSGVTMGLPLMVAILISFAPTDVMASIPSVVRPMFGNGFVMGVAMVFILEHIVFSQKK